MRNPLLKCHLGVEYIGDAKVIASVGEVECTIGETADLRVGTEITRDLKVIDKVVCAISDVPDTFLKAFGCMDFSQFRREISKGVGTGLPSETKVTIIVLKDPDLIESMPETEVVEELGESSSNILDLVVSMEDDEDTDINPDEEFEG